MASNTTGEIIARSGDVSTGVLLHSSPFGRIFGTPIYEVTHFGHQTEAVRQQWRHKDMKDFKDMWEDAAANSVGTGGVDMPADVQQDKKKKKKACL